MDTDRIPTEPTTDHEPPGVTSLTPGPSQAPTSPAAVSRGRTAIMGAGVVLALVATFSVGIGVGRLVPPSDGAAGTTPNPASPGSSTVPEEYELIREAWDVLHEQYVARDELDDRELIYGAIDGMTEAVGDTGHTDFLTPEEREERANALSGSYVGIGVRIDATEEGLPEVVGVFEGSPAEAAGVEVGAIILEVDGQSTVDRTLDEVASWVRGEAGSVVRIILRSPGSGEERELSITRADVPIEPVSWTMVPGTRIALIRLEQFSAGAMNEMIEALEGARSAGADRVVLDLRGNPGGYVNEAVGIASQFLTSGVVYIDRNAQGEETPREVSAGGVATDLPLVVMVDGNSASSSEIVSGALQDAERATIVGETTYGTGTVLGEFVLEDGSALRVGTVEWLTPSGRRIWHEGIAPDVPVELPEAAVPLTPDDVRALATDAVDSIEDTQLARALELVASEAVAGS